MCVTLHDASLGRTTIAGWRYRPRRTHCLLYGNEPENRAAVPNAMILHIPVAAGTTLTQDNFIPTSSLRYVLDDMWAAIPEYHALRETRSTGTRSTAKGITVFDMGAYTWVAATRADAWDISAALYQVRSDRRPSVTEELISFYLRTWPYDALAIGCFASARGGVTEPAAIEYIPQEWDLLRMPAVDAHGGIPDMNGQVTVNHRLIVETSELVAGGRVIYREHGLMDPRLREILPGRVAGIELPGILMANGDFYIDFSRFTTSAVIQRAHGAGLTARADQVPVPLIFPG